MNKYTSHQKKAQSYLRNIRLNERRIQVLEAEIEMQQSRLTLNGVSGGENVSKTLEGDCHEQGFVKLYELCDTLNTDLIGYVEERNQALKALANIENANYYVVLYFVYFNGMRFKELSTLLHVSERQVFNWHARALSILYRYLPIEFR